MALAYAWKGRECLRKKKINKEKNKTKQDKTTSINGKITVNLQAATLLENAASEVTRAHFILLLQWAEDVFMGRLM